MTFEWYDVVGTTGVALILVAYYLLQVGRTDVQGLFYSAANLIGAALITVSLMFEFNFASFLIEVCWIVISLVGIARYLKLRRGSISTGET